MKKDSSINVRSIAFWIAYNLGFLAILYLGTVGNPPNNIAANLLKFYVWLTLVSSVINTIVYTISRPSNSQQTVSPYLTMSIDMFIVSWLAGSGWFLYAALFISHIPMFAYYSGLLEKKKEEEKQPEQCKFVWIRVDQPNWTVRCYKAKGHQEPHNPPGELSDIPGQWIDTSGYSRIQ